MKILRFLHISRITASLINLKNIIADIFFLHTYIFDNLLSWTLAGFKLILTIHLFACGWISFEIYLAKDHNVANLFTEGSSPAKYLEAIYFITTTITTVGYGDLKGYVDNSGSWTGEMLYLCATIFCGIFLFTLVTREIFTYKSLLNVG